MKERIDRHKIDKITDAIDETLDTDYAIAVNLVKRKLEVENFVMLFQEATTAMLSGNISKNGLRIFVYLLGKLQYGNHIGVDQETIARDNGYSLVYIKKTISELKKANIIIPYQDLQDKRRNVYVVNPIIAWRGKVKNRKKFIKENPNQLDMFPSSKPSKQGGIEPNENF